MAKITDLMERMVPISEFSRGGSAKAFNLVKEGKPVVVMRNNVPIAIVIEPAEYDRLIEAEEQLKASKSK